MNNWNNRINHLWHMTKSISLGSAGTTVSGIKFKILFSFLRGYIISQHKLFSSPEGAICGFSPDWLRLQEEAAGDLSFCWGYFLAKPHICIRLKCTFRCGLVDLLTFHAMHAAHTYSLHTVRTLLCLQLHIKCSAFLFPTDRCVQLQRFHSSHITGLWDMTTCEPVT